MHRTIAAQPDLFCAYYEPSVAGEAGLGRKAARSSRAALLALRNGSAIVLRRGLALAQR